MKQRNYIIIVGFLSLLMFFLYSCDITNQNKEKSTSGNILSSQNKEQYDSYQKFALPVMPKTENKKRISKNPTVNQLFKPTLSTTQNPSTASATDNSDVRILPSSHPQSEVHISISLANPDNLLVSANTTQISTSFQGYYYSNDGGVTWHGSDHMPDSAPSRGDPMTAGLFPLPKVFMEKVANVIIFN